MPSPYEVNRNKTECLRGHAFDEANTYIDPRRGSRNCRKCKADKMRQRRNDPRTKERCREISQRAWEKNQKVYRERARVARTTVKKHLRDLKAANGCNHCGESNPDCLDWHHVDRTQKRFTIGGFGGWPSLAHIQTEIDKCIVLCANCHRKEEARLRRKGIESC